MKYSVGIEALVNEDKENQYAEVDFYLDDYEASVSSDTFENALSELLDKVITEKIHPQMEQAKAEQTAEQTAEPPKKLIDLTIEDYQKENDELRAAIESLEEANDELRKTIAEVKNRNAELRHKNTASSAASLCSDDFYKNIARLMRMF